MTVDLLQQSSPIIVKIVEEKPQGLYEVMYGALGLTGVLALASVVAAVILAAILFWVRSRST